MRLDRLFVRFYKSFNFDYELKAWRGAEPQPWEEAEVGWFPYVQVPIDASVTAVMGANESGKTQTLDAIKSALTGKGFSRADFCRYSTLYSVQKGAVRLPEVGCLLTVETAEEASALAAIPSLQSITVGDSFALIRPGQRAAFVLVNNKKSELSDDQLSIVQSVLPVYFEVKTNLGIPDSMSLSELAGDPPSSLNLRRRRSGLIDALFGDWDNASEFAEDLFPSWRQATLEELDDAEVRRREEFELGRKLLVDLAGIEQSTFAALANALKDGEEGDAEGLVGGINQAIAENLNFQRWWTQDDHFVLEVQAREREIAFTVRDRTGAKYAFDERSQGLRYFLSYFIQLSAHRAISTTPDILLLDEPDAFLSSSGQSDLLRVIEDYAVPEDGQHQNQVVYVTHSPFLVNKNAKNRIRVLDKGVDDEGTRLVRDASRSQYEPLRSSLGPNLAESSSIHGSNLIVARMSDQVLLAGASGILSSRERLAENLDLNQCQIVAAGTVDAVPYSIYLARGRDVVRPACVVLLPGTEDGRTAGGLVGLARRGGVPLLEDQYLVDLRTWAERQDVVVRQHEAVSVLELEDLIPVRVAVEAATRFAGRFRPVSDDAAKIPERAVIELLEMGQAMWESISTAYSANIPGPPLDRVGFAREVIGCVEDGVHRSPRPNNHAAFEDNFALLLEMLQTKLASAASDEREQRTGRRLNRIIQGFERDNSRGISRARAKALLREIEGVLGDSDWTPGVRAELQQLERDFGLSRDLRSALNPFEPFRDRISALQYAERLYFQDVASDVVGFGRSALPKRT